MSSLETTCADLFFFLELSLEKDSENFAFENRQMQESVWCFKEDRLRSGLPLEITEGLECKRETKD